MNKKNHIHCVYYYLHNVLCDKFGCHREISRKDVIIYLGWRNIPKNISPIVLKELEQFGMLKILNKQKVIFNKVKNNPINRLGVLYKQFFL